MIATHPFGRTGHASTRTIFGAAALGRVSQDDADRTLDLLLRYGVNHIDVAASYGDAELRLAPWLKTHRDRVFLATKTGGRTYDAAKRQIHLSLERLGVPYVDLIQLHNLADPIEWDTALSPRGGAGRVCRGARGGPGPVHRRDRARDADRGDAPAQPRTVRFRLGVAAVQLRR